jgi:hypothetical protein
MQQAAAMNKAAPFALEAAAPASPYKRKEGAIRSRLPYCAAAAGKLAGANNCAREAVAGAVLATAALKAMHLPLPLFLPALHLPARKNACSA